VDKALKQRLVGASVLIALAVIVLPMLLGGRPEGTTQEPRKIELPSQPPDLDFETRRYPIGEPDREPADEADPETDAAAKLPAPTESGAAQAVLSDSKHTSDPVPPPETGAGGAADEGPGASAPESEAVPPQRPAEELAGLESDFEDADPEPATAPAIAPQGQAVTPGRYVVQVASFGSADNANRLSESLQRKGYSVLVDSVASDVGTLSRVRIGPFDTEAQANTAVGELKQQISGINPRVMDLQPEQAAQVSNPVDPLIRWVVQVGSFSNPSNAEKLVARLRLEGMSAYHETVSGASDPIYRVRIGPFLERDEAFRIEQQVRERMALDGVVISAD
jgi:DedD protein